MKKMILTISILIVVGIAGFVGWKIFRHHVDNQIMDGPGSVYTPDVQYVSYSVGGGELGDYDTICLYEGKITAETCEGNGCRPVKKNTDVGADVYWSVTEILDNNNMKDWGELPYSDIEVLDAPTTSFNVTWADGTTLKVTSDQIVPEGGWEAIEEIRKVLASELK